MSNTQSVKLAIHERLLPGDTEAEKVQAAVDLGFSGIEYDAEGLAERVPAITAALDGQPVRACSVHMGWTHNFLHVEEPVRQAALDALRHSFTDAADIGADAVVIVPHIGEDLGLPDLMPLKAPMQIAVELMIWHLRGYSDLAYVFGLELYLHPVSPKVSAFLNRLDQGVELRRRIKFNEYVWLAADTYHMGISEDDPGAALRENDESVRMVYLSADDGSLPGQDAANAEIIANALEGDRWGVVRTYGQDRPPTRAQLTACVDHLRWVRYAG